MSSAAPDHLSMLRACAVAGDTEGFARSLGSLDTALCDSNEFLRELTALFHTAKSSSSVFSEKPEQLASALLTYFRGDSFCNSVVATVFRIDVYSQHGILLRDVEVGAKDMRDFSVLLLMEADLVGCYLDMKKVMTVEKIQMLTSLWHYFTFAVPRKVLTSLGKYRHNLKESNVYNVALWKTLMGALRAYENHAFEFSFVKMVCGFFENCSAKDLTTCFGPVIESGKDLALLQRVLKHLFEDVFESEATEDAASSQLSASCPLVAYLVSSPVTRFGDGSVLAFLKEGWQSKTVCLPHTVRQYMETNPELRGVLPVDCCKAKDSKKRARDE